LKDLRKQFILSNSQLSKEAIEEAFKKVLRTDSPDLVINNRNFHKMLTDGVDVEYRRKDGSIAGDKCWLFDFNNPENNEFIAVNQYTVVENEINRRPDIVILLMVCQ